MTLEYKQVPLKHGEVGQSFPHFIEIQDLFTATKESEVWLKFAETGEQDLEGFEGDDDEEFGAEEDNEGVVEAEFEEAYPDWTVAKIKMHPKFELFLKDRKYWLDEPAWELHDRDEDIQAWIEWLADRQESDVEQLADWPPPAEPPANTDLSDVDMSSVEYARAQPAMDLDAPRAKTRPGEKDLSVPPLSKSAVSKSAVSKSATVSKSAVNEGSAGNTQYSERYVDDDDDDDRRRANDEWEENSRQAADEQRNKDDLAARTARGVGQSAAAAPAAAGKQADEEDEEAEGEAASMENAMDDARRRAAAEAAAKRASAGVIALASEEEAAKVKAMDVLDIYKDAKTLWGRATVKKIFRLADVLQADIAWDDGDTAGLQLALWRRDQTDADPATWPRWRPSSLSEVPLFQRLHETKSPGDLMRSPDCADVTAPPASAIPKGVFGAALDVSSLDNKALAAGLAGASILFSTDLEDGREADAPVSFPRIFDLYSVMQESTSTVKAFYVCCGLASPINLKKACLEVDKGFVLGLEVKVLAKGRAAGAERTVELRDKGNKPIDDKKEPPIIAHALGDTKLRVRPVHGVDELASIIGRTAVSQLRALLLRSELFGVLAKDLEVFEGASFLPGLDKFPDGITRTHVSKLGDAILGQALLTTAKGLEAARAEQTRFFSADKQTRALQTFTNTAKDLVQMAANMPSVFYLGSSLNQAAQEKLLGKLVQLAPKLAPTTAAPPAPPAPPAKLPPATKAASKRGKDEAGCHNSPDGKLAQTDKPEKPPRSLPNPQLAALSSGVSGASSTASSSSGSPAYTPLGQGQADSNTSKMADLTVKLAVAQAELAQEKKTTIELRTQLDAVTADLKVQLEKITILQATSAGLSAEIGGLRAELKTKDKMADDLRHSQAMWSSMFMSKSEVSSSTFQSFMNATSGRGAGEP